MTLNAAVCFYAGTPVNRIPIMAKQVLDLYMLYQLVTEKGGLVEVINKKLWREITKGLNLPTSITSAAFTLRTQYVLADTSTAGEMMFTHMYRPGIYMVISHESIRGGAVYKTHSSGRITV